MQENKFGGTETQKIPSRDSIEIRTSRDSIEIRKGSGWDALTDNEISEAFNKFCEADMIDEFKEWMNMTKEEIKLHYEKIQSETLLLSFINLLLNLQLKYRILIHGNLDEGDIENIDGQLYIKEELLNFINIPNIDIVKKSFTYSVIDFINGNKKEGYFTHDQLERFINYCETYVKKEPKIINTYLMTDASGYIKIGKSQDIDKRLSTLKIGNPTIKVINFLDKNIEHELHTIYKSKRIIGEWFDLNNEDLQNIIKKYNFK
jgi:hypothetical protein